MRELIICFNNMAKITKSLYYSASTCFQSNLKSLYRPNLETKSENSNRESFLHFLNYSPNPTKTCKNLCSGRIPVHFNHKYRKRT